MFEKCKATAMTNPPFCIDVILITDESNLNALCTEFKNHVIDVIGRKSKIDMTHYFQFEIFKIILRVMKMNGMYESKGADELIKYVIDWNYIKNLDEMESHRFIVLISDTTRKLYLWDTRHNITKRYAHPLCLMISMFTRAFLAGRCCVGVYNEDLRTKMAEFTTPIPSHRVRVSEIPPPSLPVI